MHKNPPKIDFAPCQIEIAYSISPANEPRLQKALRQTFENMLFDGLFPDGVDQDKNPIGSTFFNNVAERLRKTDDAETSGCIPLPSFAITLSKQNASQVAEQQQKVDRINAIAGRSVNYNNWENMKAQAYINLQEAQEIVKACEERNLYKLRDSIGDNRVTLFGFGSICDLPINDDFDKIIEALHSRFDSTPELAKESRELWESRGLEVDTICTSFMDEVTSWEYLLAEKAGLPMDDESVKERISNHLNAIGEPADVRYYVTISAKDQTVNGEHYPKGKFLKSKYFKEPVFTELDWTLQD